ncbi:hypothetical protein [Listeria floridensis]|uniref:hypothetical protein n=1 Tax=Listeria floridensis TaxID=1494962 RepID=UPI0005600E14|nr:hypothetical protein [Listeria floridensis]
MPVFGFSSTAFAEEESTEKLQQLIDKAAPNETIRLKGMIYLGPAKVDKPLTIIGTEGTYIGSLEKEKPAIEITGQGVTLENLTIMLTRQTDDTPAIKVSGTKHHFKNLEINSTGRGILAEKNVIFHI